MKTKPCGRCGKPTTGTEEDRPLCLKCHVGPKRFARWRELRRTGKEPDPGEPPIGLSDEELFEEEERPKMAPGWAVRWTEPPTPKPVRGDTLLVMWKSGGFIVLKAADVPDGDLWWCVPGPEVRRNRLYRPGAAWENHVLAWSRIKRGNR